MESAGRPERGAGKMAFSLGVTHQEINGSGESAVSPGQGTERFEGRRLQLILLGVNSGGGSFWEAMSSSAFLSY